MKFTKQVDLTELGEDYKDRILEFKKPNLSQAMILGKMNEDISYLEKINDIIVDLYVGEVITKEELASDYMTFDVQTLILETLLTQNDFLLKRQK